MGFFKINLSQSKISQKLENEPHVYKKIISSKEILCTLFIISEFITLIITLIKIIGLP